MNRREFVTTGIAASAAIALPAAAEGRPKKSVMFAMLPGNLSLNERFKLAKDVGFEGVECGPVGNEKAATDLRAAAEKAGIPIHSIIFGGWDAPMTTKCGKSRGILIVGHGDADVREGF